MVVSMKLRVLLLTKDNHPTMRQKLQIQKNREYIDHLWQNYNLQQTVSGMMFLWQHHNGPVFVHLRAYHIGMPCII
jgi:hypothetical protein